MYCGTGEAIIRAVEAPRIEAFNGNDGCRRDASFIRDLHRRGLLFRRVAFVTGCTQYRREHQLKGGTSVLACFFFFFLISHHSLTTIWSIREKRASLSNSNRHCPNILSS